jgi:tRNA nucleotidyltransferase (CCA-adding enzyme)
MKIIPLNDLNLIKTVKDIKKSEAFLVGGCVRDWYLGRKCFDIDITFKDYPIEIAKFLSEKFSFKYQEFKDFLTIRLISENRRIDLATFRKEKYPYPASLPVVEISSSIEEDLKRRDFTVNSIAISLNNDTYRAVDPFGGIDDIENKKIRVLHKKSFIDDPTRIFRAIRFSKRFGWEIEKNTMDLLERDKKYIKELSKERIRNEIIKILQEDNCYEMLLMIKDLKLLDKDELFDFDKEIDDIKDLNERYLYIAKKNGMKFFEYYNFERKIKNQLKKRIKP